MIRLNLAVARSCFVRCRGCYNFFSGERQLVSLESICAFLAYCQRHSEVGGVTLCGGDPLSRPDIVPLVSSIVNMGIPVKLDTVGTAFLDRTEVRFFGTGWVDRTDPARIVPLLNWVGVPLDGWSEESVALFREGRARLFAETLEILGMLGGFDTPFGVNTVVHRGNVDHLARIEEVVSRFRVSEWQLFEYRPSGPLSFRNRDHFALPDGRFAEQAAAFAGTRTLGDRTMLVTTKSAREFLPSRLMVDSYGLAASHMEWVEPPAGEPGPRRAVAGNIQNPDDYPRILAAAEASMEGRILTEGQPATTGWMSHGAQP